MMVNLDRFNRDYGFWNLPYPYALYECFIETSHKWTKEEAETADRIAVLKEHLDNVSFFALQQLKNSEDYQYPSLVERSVPTVPKQKTGKYSFFYSLPFQRLLKTGNGDLEVVEGDEVYFSVGVTVEERILPGTEEVNFRASTCMYLRRTEMEASEGQGSLIVTMKGFDINKSPYNGIHPAYEDGKSPENEIITLSNLMVGNHVRASITARLIDGDRNDPLMNFEVCRLPEHSFTELTFIEDKTKLEEKDWIIPEKMAPEEGKEGLKDAFIEVLEKDYPESSITTQEVNRDFDKAIDQIKTLFKNMFNAKMHPVPDFISPGSFLYHLFKAHVQNDEEAVNTVTYMITTNQVSDRERLQAKMAIVAYLAGYKRALENTRDKLRGQSEGQSK